MLSAVTHHWVIGALFAAVAGCNSACSVTPVSVRETPRRPTAHSEAANLRPSLASSGKISSGQIVEKVELNLRDRIATKGFSRSGLVVKRIVLAEKYEIKGLRHRYRTLGEGQAAVALLTPRPQSPLRTFYTTDYVYVPVTIVNPCGGSRMRDEGRCFRIIDDESPAEQGRGKLGALATDTTLPLAMLLSHTRFVPQQYRGLLHPDRFGKTRGLFLLEPYDSNKVPILMIHGLMSSPLTWKELTNELLGDAYVRTHYQIWHYIYPTGQSLFHSAKGLRDSLDALKMAVALAHLPQPKPMVVIGHSMGGLLAKSLVCDSGDNLWDAVFTVRPERLAVSKDAMNDLRGSFFFKARKDVAKVIFMATQQRGSYLAANWLGRLGSRLIHLTGDWSVENRLIAREQKASIRPQMLRYFARGGSSSIESLSPKHPLLAAFESLVPDTRIPCYLVIGSVTRTLSGVISDGVVTFDSANLQYAKQTIILRGAGHGGVTNDSRAIAWIINFLKHRSPQRQRYDAPH
jgi:pimeloyl-ACP methyl ester carboxylesterase